MTDQPTFNGLNLQLSHLLAPMQAASVETQLDVLGKTMNEHAYLAYLIFFLMITYIIYIVYTHV